MTAPGSAPADIIYLINVDWFFKSHFAHLAKRAADDGRKVTVVTEVGGSTQLDPRFEVVALPTRRSGLRPSGLMQAASILRQLLERKPGAILHGFGTFGIVIGALASRRRPSQRTVYHLTGSGYLAANRSAKARFVGLAVRTAHRIADHKNVRWIAENTRDLRVHGLDRTGRAIVVGGAGVDLNHFAPAPVSAEGPVRFAFVARLIQSKGLDVAVRGIELARARGHDVTLTIAGTPDPGNPSSWTDADIAALEGVQGIDYAGFVGDIRSFWARHDIAVLLSRGGEGVPKTLLESSACARPMITTNVPGCFELATEADGWIVPVDDAERTADAISAAVADRTEIQRRGLKARAAIERNYSEDAVWRAVNGQYEELTSG